ncbi:hypothetical protein CQW23_17623 [Capsicum baccatum]|uniref:F-box associated domain-containing protein n=1 Tax=Capsicum baccatum TaxID=33114 RepID=A0A2G2WED7_CAPBA|nr:hypothetical protein CQW23_17623 [Capsicum baccatum]
MFTYDGDSPDWTNYVTVASLKGKNWRKPEFAYDIISDRDGITLHGRLHYRVRVKNTSSYNESIWDRFGQCNKVIYFDPIFEKFHRLPIPECDQEENAVAGLGISNECLCMTRLEHDRGLMKEYGIKESGTSLFFIKNQEIPHCGFVVPFYVTENGEVALIIDVIDCRAGLRTPGPKAKLY